MNRRSESEWNDKITVRVDPELADLIPGFLDNRRKDVEFVHGALKQGDFEVIRTVGHKMRGDGGGYGFQEISEIGEALEQAAKHRNSIQIHRWVKELSNYLERIEVVYD